MKQIKINKPYLEEIGNKIRLCAEIEKDREKTILWYEVDKKFGKYLCNEHIDAFVVMLIPFIVEHGYDIISNGLISEKLYYQLTNYELPLMCEYLKREPVTINCDTDDMNFKGKEVGTGLSGGVDSFYTISKNIKNTPNYQLTYLTFFNVGASGDFGGIEARNLFKARIDFVKNFAEENNLGFITIDSNISEFINMDYIKTHTFRSLSAVLALQKLFKTYYYSSGYCFQNSHISDEDCAYYDILNMQCLSTESVSFYNQGMETTRIGKAKEISNYSPTYKYLNVCVKEDHNCSKCEKCLRTMFALDSLGVLDKYKKVFDIEDFRKHMFKNYIFLLKKVHKKNRYYIESYEMYRKNKVKIPLLARIISYIPNLHDIWYYTPEPIRKKLRKYVKKNEKRN